MSQSNDDETADEKFDNFEKALKQVLSAPKPPPSGNGENSSHDPEIQSG
jgi:hypothetical protein